MPLRRSAVGRASRKDEVSALLGWNGEAEDAAPCSTPLTFAPHLPTVSSGSLVQSHLGDDRPSRCVTCITDRRPRV